MALTVLTLSAALERCAAAVEAAAPELNERDGVLGDGDLGATLSKCAVNVRAILPHLDEDLGNAFRSCATACSKASGSSFGTLLAVAMLTVAKRTAGQRSLEWSELPELLGAVLEALSARGGAKLGDKTVLDALDAARRAEPTVAAARVAVQGALDAFRDQPNKIGRARMFAERSVGLDDPGMVALLRMVEGLSQV